MKLPHGYDYICSNQQIFESMQNVAMKYGVQLGLFMILLTFALYFINPMLFANNWVGIGIIVVLIVVPILAIRDKKRQESGVINFKNAFITAFICLTIASAMSTVAMIVVFNALDTSLADKVSEEIALNALKMMKDFGTPAEVIDQKIEEFKDMPDGYSVQGQLVKFAQGLIANAVIALILALIMKSKREDLDNAILEAQQY